MRQVHWLHDDHAVVWWTKASVLYLPHAERAIMMRIPKHFTNRISGCREEPYFTNRPETCRLSHLKGISKWRSWVVEKFRRRYLKFHDTVTRWHNVCSKLKIRVSNLYVHTKFLIVRNWIIFQNQTLLMIGYCLFVHAFFSGCSTQLILSESYFQIKIQKMWP